MNDYILMVGNDCHGANGDRNQCSSRYVIFDMISSEFVCSSCGCVANDKSFNIEHNGGRMNSIGV